jgi:hypothetical protein
MAKIHNTATIANDPTIPDDPDHEWVACIGIEAASEEKAQGWGDRLARDRAGRSGAERFLRSSVELKADAFGVSDWSTMPRIRAGQPVSDEEIGW